LRRIVFWGICTTPSQCYANALESPHWYLFVQNKSDPPYPSSLSSAMPSVVAIRKRNWKQVYRLGVWSRSSLMCICGRKKAANFLFRHRQNVIAASLRLCTSGRRSPVNGPGRADAEQVAASLLLREASTLMGYLEIDRKSQRCLSSLSCCVGMPKGVVPCERRMLTRNAE
jgi:hypothetical protein